MAYVLDSVAKVNNMFTETISISGNSIFTLYKNKWTIHHILISNILPYNITTNVNSVEFLAYFRRYYSIRLTKNLISCCKTI